MKFKAFHLRKANSGFFYEVNIGKGAIFDVCNTSTSLSESESRECNTEKKKHRKCDFHFFFFFFLFFFIARVVLSAHLAHLSALAKNMKNVAGSK